MTETLHEPAAGPPPPPPSEPPLRLVRDPSRRVVAGVCAGLGRATGTDPVLWRVTVAVLALFGGAGLLLYAVAWLLVPRDGAPESVVERLVRGTDIPRPAAAVLAVLLVVTLAVVADDGRAPLVLLVLAGLAVLVARERRATGPVPPAPLMTAEPAAAARWDGTTWGAGSLPVAARAPRPRSRLGLLTVSAALVAVGALLLAREAGADQVTVPRVLAAALLVVGAGLLVGTWFGRARWLLLPGLLLVGALCAASALDGMYGYAVGERTWAPTASSGASYRLAAGQGVLDLSRLAPGELERVQASVGAGELLVRVPAGLRVQLQTRAGGGEVVRLDAAGRPAPPDLGGPGTGPVTVLDLTVGVGRIEVRRAAA